MPRSITRRTATRRPMVSFHELCSMPLLKIAEFSASGDFVFGGFSEDLGSLLNDGVKVALIHGDRDFRCNCKLPDDEARREAFETNA